MRVAMSEIFARVGGDVNQDASSPAAGGTEWTLWLSFLNRSVAEWASSHDWEILRKTFRPVILGTTQATIALPQDFRKLAASPVHWGTGVTGGEEWPEVLSEQQRLYSNTDSWIQIKGDPSNGYNLIWNPGTLASGASLTIDYFSMPTSLASPVQIPIIPDPEYLVSRISAFVWQARSDTRFQQAEVKTREKLLNMIESADAAKYNSYAGSSPVLTTERRLNFRLGRD